MLREPPTREILLVSRGHRTPMPGHTGCGHADDILLPLMRQQGRFVDQEAFDPDAAG